MVSNRTNFCADPSAKDVSFEAVLVDSNYSRALARSAAGSGFVFGYVGESVGYVGKLIGNVVSAP